MRSAWVLLLILPSLAEAAPAAPKPATAASTLAVRQPRVSRDLAVALGARAAGIVRVDSDRAELRVLYGRAQWSLLLRGNYGNGYAGQKCVEIDAESGLVVGYDLFRMPPVVDAMPDQCLVVQPPIIELTLRPKRYEGRIWVPADFARLFDLRVEVRDARARLADPNGADRGEAPVAQLEGVPHLPAEDLLRAAGVLSDAYIRSDLCSIAVLRVDQAVSARIAELGLGHALRPVPLPPWPDGRGVPLPTASTRPALAKQRIAMIASKVAGASAAAKRSLRCYKWLPGVRPGGAYWVVRFSEPAPNEPWRSELADPDDKVVVVDGFSGEVLGVTIAYGLDCWLSMNPTP